MNSLLYSIGEENLDKLFWVWQNTNKLNIFILFLSGWLVLIKTLSLRIRFGILEN